MPWNCGGSYCYGAIYKGIFLSQFLLQCKHFFFPLQYLVIIVYNGQHTGCTYSFDVHMNLHSNEQTKTEMKEANQYNYYNSTWIIRHLSVANCHYSFWSFPLHWNQIFRNQISTIWNFLKSLSPPFLIEKKKITKLRLCTHLFQSIVLW